MANQKSVPKIPAKIPPRTPTTVRSLRLSSAVSTKRLSAYRASAPSAATPSLFEHLKAGGKTKYFSISSMPSNGKPATVCDTEHNSMKESLFDAPVRPSVSVDISSLPSGLACNLFAMFDLKQSGHRDDELDRFIFGSRQQQLQPQ